MLWRAGGTLSGLGGLASTPPPVAWLHAAVGPRTTPNHEQVHLPGATRHGRPLLVTAFRSPGRSAVLASLTGGQDWATQSISQLSIAACVFKTTMVAPSCHACLACVAVETIANTGVPLSLAAFQTLSRAASARALS